MRHTSLFRIAFRSLNYYVSAFSNMKYDLHNPIRYAQQFVLTVA